MRSWKENILEIRVRRKIFCDSVLGKKINHSEKESILDSELQGEYF